MADVLFRIHGRRGREIAHRVAGAAEWGRVRLGAVHDPGFVQAAFVRLQREINGLRLVYDALFDLRWKDIAGFVGDFFIVGEPAALAARNHRHATVFSGRFVYRQPDGADAFHGGSPALPVRRVLMPGRSGQSPRRYRLSARFQVLPS